MTYQPCDPAPQSPPLWERAWTQCLRQCLRRPGPALSQRQLSSLLCQLDSVPPLDGFHSYSRCFRPQPVRHGDVTTAPHRLSPQCDSEQSHTRPGTQSPHCRDGVLKGGPCNSWCRVCRGNPNHPCAPRRGENREEVLPLGPFPEGVCSLP